MAKCIFCGADLVEGVCPNAAQHFKPMCLNCVSCKEKEEGFVCVNPTLIESALQKAKEALPAGYEFETVTLKPLLLKDPSKKCKIWSINFESLTNFYKNVK